VLDQLHLPPVVADSRSRKMLLTSLRPVKDCLTMTLARMRSVVLDCPDPRALAEFYQRLLGGEVDSDLDDWVVLTSGGLRLAFQLADEFAAPTWPTGDRPQQFHLDVTVEDPDAVEPEVLSLGAVKHAVQPGEAEGDQFRVYLDPAGHPFCLCWD
jgi:catechol 2,3-dioxygenase-like lactoylglutathione lyase family enzyme